MLRYEFIEDRFMCFIYLNPQLLLESNGNRTYPEIGCVYRMLAIILTKVWQSITTG
jgi:hypothetical protein